MTKHATPGTGEDPDIAQLHSGIRDVARELDTLIRANPCTGTDCTGCALGRIQYQLLTLLYPKITIDTQETS